MSDEEVVAALTQVKGIGVWTAKMFLIFHLDRPDVNAHEDLGIRIAVARAYGVRRDRAARKARALTEAWSPYGSLANLVLWNWRRKVTTVTRDA
jgi:DNA-3-methyladenine glycosylase II